MFKPNNELVGREIRHCESFGINARMPFDEALEVFVNNE